MEGGTRKTITVGPWGGHGGTSWDDGSFSGVRTITLVYDNCIDSIRVEYDKNGKAVWAEKHGGSGGTHTTHIRLKYPEEFLASVSGHYCPVVQTGTPVIRSLAFQSNKRTFGPFGMQVGTPFTFPMDGGLIIGFKGKSGWYLDSIGFRLSRLHNSNLFDNFKSKLHKLMSQGNAQQTAPQGKGYNKTHA